MSRKGIEIKGLGAVLKKIQGYPDRLKKEVDAIIGQETAAMVDRAVRDAPTDVGFLKNQIVSERHGEMNYTVVSGAGYSVYVEFGTKRHFNNPYPSLSAYVGTFKGKGGEAGGKGFYDEILAWVRRKGFASQKTASGARSRSLDSRIAEEQAAFAIYMYILRHGTKPHPFFFRNYFIATQNILKRIRQAVKDQK